LWRSRFRSGVDGLRCMLTPIREVATIEAVFSREDSLAEVVEDHIRSANHSIRAAVYRFNSRRIARALGEAHRKGIRVCLVIDNGRYDGSRATQELLAKAPYPFRLAQGRHGESSKMHHKFIVLDEWAVLTGSYNWTYASEEKNYDNLLILREPSLIQAHRREFEELWAEGIEPHLAGSSG